MIIRTILLVNNADMDTDDEDDKTVQNGENYTGDGSMRMMVVKMIVTWMRNPPRG